MSDVLSAILPDGTSATQDDPKSKPVARQSALGAALARTKSVAVAVGLSRVYEFIEKNGELVHSISKEPALHHSYFAPTPETTYQYETAQRSKAFKITKNGSKTIDLPIGVTLLFGRSGSGKTRFAFEHLLCSNIDQCNMVYEKMFEPGDDAAMALVAGDTLRIPQLEADLAIDIAEFLFSAHAEVMIVDSLRYLFYSSGGGSTGKGGVNMGLFMVLTHLDRLAMTAGKRLIVVVNPLTDDETAFSAYIEAGLGAVSGVIVMHDYITAEIASRYAPTRDFAPIKLPRRTSLDVARAAAIENSVTVDMHSAVNQPAPLSTSIFDRKGTK